MLIRPDGDAVRSGNLTWAAGPCLISEPLMPRHFIKSTDRLRLISRVILR